MNKVMTGYVIRMFLDRGYGFIRGEDMKSRFVHANDVIPKLAFDTLTPGMKVTFKTIDFGEEDKDKGNGLRAVEVRVANNVTEPEV